VVDTRAVSPLARAGLWILNFVRSPVGIEGDAWLCTRSHPLAWYIGAPDPPPDPQHVDVELRMWNRSANRLTVFDVASARAGDQPLKVGRYHSLEQVTLEPGGPRATIRFELAPEDDSALTAGAGDEVTLRFKTSRGVIGTLGRPAIRLALADSPRRRS